MQHRVFLQRHPVFTKAELAAHLASRGGTGPRSQEAFLAYYTRTGRVVRVRRGLYAVLPPGAELDSYPVNPYLIAGKLAEDAVLSHHTALEYHGRAHSVWQHFLYSASRPVRKVAFRSRLYRGARFPAALLRTGTQHVEVVETEQEGVTIRVTSLERTLVDVLHRPALAGGWEEVWRSLESVEYFNLESVLEYTLLLRNATTAAKVGLFLEQNREPLMVDECHLQALRDRRPSQPHYMDPARQQPGRLVPEWNLVVPNEVLTRSWEEVS